MHLNMSPTGFAGNQHQHQHQQAYGMGMGNMGAMGMGGMGMGAMGMAGFQYSPQIGGFAQVCDDLLPS